MTITSTAFRHNQLIPPKYTCDGENISPPLAISDIPSAAKSLALIVDDPDAPGGIWVHWLMWNITPETTRIEAGMAPLGATEGTTSFGKPGYCGPSPPSGTHRYFFKVYALDAMLNLLSGADKDELEHAMEGHILARAEIVEQ